jgi:3-(3-hydroxy-phenyl)propionate hydroxylase
MNAHQHVRIAGASGRPLAEVAFDDAGNGMPGLAFFLQPELERALRAGLAGLPTVEVALGTELEGFAQDDRVVTAVLRDAASGERRAVRASYLLACDGARSSVRRALGIGFSGSTFEQRWLVVDLATPRPLAHLPYYTAVCDPARPFVNMPCPGGHRFEWMLHPGEDEAAMTDPATVRALLAPHLDPDAVEVLRAVVYTFHARMASRWRDGRVLLAGDAAHAMPPFAGQGLGSGIRDAANVAWKLAAVVDGRAADALLDSYERERRPHVQAMIRLNALLGAIFQSTDRRVAAARDGLLRGAMATPLGAWVRRGGPRPAPALPRRARPRIGARGGAPLVRARVRTLEGAVGGLDDVVGGRFALLGAGADPRRSLDADALAIWEALGAEYLQVVPRGGRATGAPERSGEAPVIEDLDGRLVRQLRGGVAIVRPDRFVVGVVAPRALSRATRRYATRLGRPAGAPVREA